MPGLPPIARIAYLTDVEGRWDKVESFATDNPDLSLVDGELRLSDGVTFVFGGDAIDRGPHGLRFLNLLLAARRRYGPRVVLLAGNRDVNKLRLLSELNGQPHRRAPTGLSRVELLKWTFANTMGAAKAFEHRATELQTSDDDAVLESVLADVAPGGPVRAYLNASCLGFRAGATLFVHGGLTEENFLLTPGAEKAESLDAWLAQLNGFLGGELQRVEQGLRPDALIAYQAQGPNKLNQASVVYARPGDALGNPHLPPRAIVEHLLREGVRRVVIGHTPSGDCPAVLRSGSFELVLADNSYGRIELGSQVSLTDDALTVRGMTELDDGARAKVHFTLTRDDVSPLGCRERTSGRLVKARLEDGAFLLFRALPEFRVEQRSVVDPGGELDAPW